MTGPSKSILSAVNLLKQFTVPSQKKSGGVLTALDDVSLELAPGETLGIAGESGCGKSTLGKVLSGLMKPDRGDVLYHGSPLTSLSDTDFKAFRRTTQMIFQDPFSSLNPRMRIGDIIAEPFVIGGELTASERHDAVLGIIGTVGLNPDMLMRFPVEFSGGQRQRIGIARALAASPAILIADEPVSSLDISIQAQIINLLQQMKSEYSLSLIMISHNLSVLRHMCDRVIIMYLGIIVEIASASDLFLQCRHPYTEALIAAIPKLDPGERRPFILSDDLPSPLAIPPGCRFHPRCRYAVEVCKTSIPPLVEVTSGHLSACHLATTFFQSND